MDDSTWKGLCSQAVHNAVGKESIFTAIGESLTIKKAIKMYKERAGPVPRAQDVAEI